VTAPHFFADSVEPDQILIAGPDGRHAVRVLRIRRGEAVTVSDGRGRVVEGIAEPGPDGILVAVRARSTAAEGRPRVHVYPAVPKSGKLELVVQKLTEIGVASIRPWFAERTVVRWDAPKRAANGERLRAVAREAGKQCRAARLPEVGDPAELPAALPGLALVLHEGAQERLHEALPADPPTDLAVVVGPEGGLSDEEVSRLVASGARAAGLGPAILRAETAAILVPALVLGRYLLLG
jgi:16S rRNA (uracil1498-N3)-methyltransferase